MASSGVNEDDTTATVTHDSDEIEEISCEQCEKYDGKYEVASGFCLNCTEYMCSVCIQYHTRYMPGHHIQNKATMPQDVCNEKCPDHSDQVIKFYCPSCDQTACTLCKTSKHTNCKNVAHLPALVKDIENSKEMQELEDEFEDISKDIEDTDKLLDSNKRFINNVEDTAKSVVNNHKDKLLKAYNKLQKESIEDFDRKMNEIIDNLKKERQEKVDSVAKKESQLKQKINMAGNSMLKSVDNKKDSVADNIDKLSQYNKAISMQVENLKLDIEVKKKTQQRCKLFTAIRSAKTQADGLKQNINNIKSKTEIQPFKVEPNEFEMTREKLEESKSFFSIKHIHCSYRKKEAAFLYSIPLQFEVTSMCLLSEAQLLVTDEKKESVLNYKDLKRNKDVFEVIKISSRPATVAKFEGTEAVVTLPNLGIITVLSFLTSTKLLNKTEEIKVSRSCYGIACCQKKLVVSFLKPPRIEVINKQGEVLSTFDTDSENMPLFSVPRHLVVSPENTKLYVVDIYRKSITCMTFDGKIESVYKEKMQVGMQLAVDMSGSIYVCEQISNTVNQLSADLTYVKTLLDISIGIRNPCGICCNEKILLVSDNMPNKTNVKVFKIVYE